MLIGTVYSWQDPNWDELLRYCSDNNSYNGCPLPERQNHAEEEQSGREANSNPKFEIENPSASIAWRGESSQLEEIAQWPDGWK